jgi:hypothetical protein
MMDARKMPIYTPQSVDGFELCHPVHHDDFEHINVSVDGTRRRNSWRPLEMQIIREDEGRVLSVSDSPWLGSHALFFRTQAIEVLEPLLSEHGELLPVHCEDAEVLLFNPTRVLDALDEGASNILRFGDGRVMRVNEYVFHPEVVRDTHVFKIPNLRVSPTFISEHFVETWKSAGLKGLEFKEVWR